MWNTWEKGGPWNNYTIFEGPVHDMRSLIPSPCWIESVNIIFFFHQWNILIFCIIKGNWGCKEGKLMARTSTLDSTYISLKSWQGKWYTVCWSTLWQYTHPDSYDRLRRSRITQYCCGYSKLEYLWRHYEGTLRRYCDRRYRACSSCR